MEGPKSQPEEQLRRGRGSTEEQWGTRFIFSNETPGFLSDKKAIWHKSCMGSRSEGRKI